MALVRNTLGHAITLTVGSLAASEERNIDVSPAYEQQLITQGVLLLIDESQVPPQPAEPLALTSRRLFVASAQPGVLARGDVWFDKTASAFKETQSDGSLSPLMVGGSQVVVYDAGWPATRPVTLLSVLAIGPSAPSWLVDGDAFVDTDAVADSGGGSFEKAIGICRTYGSPEAITSPQPVSADRMNYMRIKGDMPGSTGAGIGVATTATGLLGLGVYANSGLGDSAVPGARKCTTGPVAIPASTSLTKIPWLEGATDVVEGDWLGFVCNEITTSRFYRQTTLYPASAIAAGLSLAQNGATGGTPPASASGTFVSQATWLGRIFQ